ncbi:GGDEF domain-containing response regulator [Halodesulfovibrio marinisediminis]|uniref:diguanylate cyclase n=1 Tax=Halodesulfovibrio marinisediminis DSM 17456 TaxID=1121457 RepID=A0A1N6GXF6_9BACT|nr:diguanylate cyclase [Halodesulfovibrio marinisediminis]SIO12176.1 response regulator receiver modulated diguanylate cyclase [Halodesulfovibrio marinisediminis DSM 17456]
MGIAKVLIVDDRPENLLTLESLLEQPGIEIIRANSGEEALEQMLDHDFALILLDVQMPGMDGYEVAELMRGNKKTKHIPIIFVTAEGKAKAQVFKGYESGAVDYLFKPLDVHIFKSKVGVFIELFHHKEALKQKSFELDQKLAELEELQQQLELTNEQLLLLSITDGLTGLQNKRQFNKNFTNEWNRAYRNQSPLSLVLIDLDFFKAYNDTYGHAKGDECLVQVAQMLSETVKRDVDKTARIGGEEFAIILPDTELAGAKYVAERFLANIESLAIPHEGSPVSDHVTVSVGAASIIPTQKEDTLSLIKAADAALYKAKADGRNSCCTAGFECEIGSA